MTATKTLLTTDVEYGVKGEIPPRFRDFIPWTVTMTTQRGTESFAFYVGRSVETAPTAFDVIYASVMDQNFLESEPERVDWPTGKSIEANSAKMAAVFGDYWVNLQCMDEEQLADAVQRLEA